MLVAGNWKMNGSLATAAALAECLAQQRIDYGKVQVAVFPPAVHLPVVVHRLQQARIDVGAQNLSEHADGAFTGELSCAMLIDVGCSMVLVGHSERRAQFDEDNRRVAEKYAAAEALGLTPILCVGETLAEREAGATAKVVAAQISAVADRVGMDRLCAGVIAYEPVWAIGTGVTASPQQAQEVHAGIRQQLGAAGEITRILYGGSVNPENAEGLFAQPDINGGLIGGASLQAADFLRIIQLAEEA
jgi:triosephosphate isomerase